MSDLDFNTESRRVYDYLVDKKLLNKIMGRISIKNKIYSVDSFKQHIDENYPDGGYLRYESKIYFDDSLIKTRKYSCECYENLDSHHVGDLSNSSLYDYSYETFKELCTKSSGSEWINNNLFNIIINKYGITKEVLDKNQYKENYELFLVKGVLENNLAFLKEELDKKNTELYDERRKFYTFQYMMNPELSLSANILTKFFIKKKNVLSFIKDTGLIRVIGKEITKEIFPDEKKATVIDPDNESEYDITCGCLYFYNDKQYGGELKEVIRINKNELSKYENKKCVLVDKKTIENEKNNPIYDNQELLNQIAEDYGITDEVITNYYTVDDGYILKGNLIHSQKILDLSKEYDTINKEYIATKKRIEDIDNTLNNKKRKTR